MAVLRFFTKPDCQLCDAAWYVVRRGSRNFDVTLERVDITAPGQESWHAQYCHDIPVVHLDGREIFRHRVHEGDLRRLLAARCNPSDRADAQETQ